MSPEEFQRTLARVDAMTQAGHYPAYWCGFRRGLQRAHHGRRFSTNTDHYAWLDFAHDADPFVAQLGRGYRDGLDAVASGRSPVLHGHRATATADGAAAATGLAQKL